MKKSKIINLVLVTASLSSCTSFVPSWQTTPPSENISIQDTTNHPYWGDDYNNWHFNYWHWCHPFYRHCYLSEAVHYGPRQPVASNVRHHGPISRGGFGRTAHSGGGHSASA